MEQEIKSFLTSFKKASTNMVATNAAAYNIGRHNYSSTRSRDYTIEEIESIISSGSVLAQQKLSQNYFRKDGFYKQILMYYATLLKYQGVLIVNPIFGKTLSKSNIEKRYYSALDFIEKISIPSLLTKISIEVLVNGCYYGLIQSIDKSGIVIIDLPASHCQSKLKDLYGNDIVEFDLNYFYSIFDKNVRAEALALYPSFISKAFKAYDKGKTSQNWIYIPADMGVYFSLFGDSNGGCPPFLHVIKSTIDYDNAVEIEKKRDLEEIKKIIVQKIPHLTDGGLLFEPEEAEEIHKGTVGMMKGNENVSVLTTYADVDAIVSKTSADTVSNNLEKAVSSIYYQSGTSSELFNSTGSSSTPYSIRKDVALMMCLGNKYSHFLTRIINQVWANSNINFTYKILNISYQNEKDFIDQSFKLASTGYSFILPSLALGLNQRDLNNIKTLENDILKLGEKLIPLSSAFNNSNISGNNNPSQEDSKKAGAQEKPTEEQSEKTQKNKQSIDNTGQGGSN